MRASTERRHRPLARARGVATAAALATALAAAVAGCAGTGAATAVVTITSTVPAAGAPAAGPASRPALRPGTGSSTLPPAASPAGSAPSVPATAASAPASVPAAAAASAPSSPPTSAPRSTTHATRGTATTSGTAAHRTAGPTARTGRSSKAPPASLSTGDLIVAAIAAAARAGVAPADPDTPGPQGGPACPTDTAYVNEKPTGLRSDVVTAWRVAVADARKHGITLCLNDGKRSRAQQQAQFDQYVSEYGREVAEQLVLPPNKSAHVVGIAVDVQPADAYRWLQSTDGSLGFCRIYDNEPWHFEFNPDYRSTGCPARLTEPER